MKAITLEYRVKEIRKYAERVAYCGSSQGRPGIPVMNVVAHQEVTLEPVVALNDRMWVQPRGDIVLDFTDLEIAGRLELGAVYMIEIT